MLTEAQLNALLSIFDARWHKLVTEYLSMMGDHLHDIGQLLPSDANRIAEMKRMGVNIERIHKQIAHAAQASMEDIEKAFAAIAKENADFMAQVLAQPHEAVLSSARLRRTLEAQYRLTMETMMNLSRTTIVSDAYRNAVDVAVQAVQGGVSDYTSAIRSAMMHAADDGLSIEQGVFMDENGTRRVVYGGGRTIRLDTAVRQNVLDGMRSLNQNIMMAIGEEFGANGVEISAHALCAEDHLDVQGQQMGMKFFQMMQGEIPNTMQVKVLDRPIGMWNCKHTVHPIIIGISEPTYTNEELKDFRQQSTQKIIIEGIDDKERTRYEWTQYQRQIETAVRYAKDRAVLAQHAGDERMNRDCTMKINALNDVYQKVCDNAFLKPQRDRMYVPGYKYKKIKV